MEGMQQAPAQHYTPSPQPVLAKGVDARSGIVFPTVGRSDPSPPLTDPSPPPPAELHDRDVLSFDSLSTPTTGSAAASAPQPSRNVETQDSLLHPTSEELVCNIPPKWLVI